MTRRTPDEMIQVEAEVYQFIATHNPTTVFKTSKELRLPLATTRSVMDKMLVAGKLDRVETSYRRLYRVAKTIKDLPDTKTEKVPKMVSKGLKKTRSC